MTIIGVQLKSKVSSDSYVIYILRLSIEIDGDSLPKDSPTISPFKVNVDESVLVDLKDRLNKARLPTEAFDDTNFEYGFRADVLRKVINHWSTKYDWRAQEKVLNKYDQFKTQIEGLDIHFYHVKASSSAKTILPLLAVHGWPGSVVEYQKLIPLLTQPDKDGVAFEMVVPSLPGYGWSEGSHKPGLNIVHIGRILAKLMNKLGHQRFYYQGGDWGSLIGKAIAALYPEKIRGVSLSFPIMPINLKVALKVGIGAIMPSLVFDDPRDTRWV